MTNKIKISFLIAGLTVVLIITTGSIFYKFSEHLTWLDAFYSTILLLSTAGFGNIAPAQPISKIFTIIFVLIGIPAILFCLGYIIEEFIKQRFQKIEQKVNEVMDKENKILKDEDRILNEEAEILKKRP